MHARPRVRAGVFVYVYVVVFAILFLYFYLLFVCARARVCVEGKAVDGWSDRKKGFHKNEVISYNTIRIAQNNKKKT